MKVVILCGGQGTRIRDVADDIPKPMIKIGDKPILWHILKYYSHFDFNDFILCLGYKREIIHNFFLNYETNNRDFTIKYKGCGEIKYHNYHDEYDWRITLANTGIDSATGARIYKIKKYLAGEENFLLTYGDGLSNVDLHKLLKFHLQHKKILTITGVRTASRFGEIIHKNNLVTDFDEKPLNKNHLISGGFFVCRKEIFNYFTDEKNLSFEMQVIKNVVKDLQAVVFEHDNFWQPMDTYREFTLLNDLYKNNNAPWVVW